MAVVLTKREKIVAQVVARLQSIAASNVTPPPVGYQTNIGQNVYYWRTGAISEEELSSFAETAALVVRDLDETKATDGDHTKVTKLSTEKHARDLHMQVEIVCGGSDAPSRVHKIIADIEMAIKNDVRWKADGKPLAIGTRPRIDRSIVEQESRKIGGVVYEFFILYVTDSFNPYQ
jgi:hypothetical protein